MARKSYIGISNKSKNIPNKGYVGINNKSKKLLKGYVGVNGKAKLFWSADELVYVLFDKNFSIQTSKYKLDGVRTGSLGSRIDIQDDFEHMQRANPFLLGYVIDGYQVQNDLIKGSGVQNLWLHDNDNTEWVVKNNAINKEVTGASANGQNLIFIPTNRIHFKKSGAALGNTYTLSMRFMCKGTSSVAGVQPKITVSFAYLNSNMAITRYGGTDILIDTEYNTYSQTFTFQSFSDELFFDYLVIASDMSASGDFTVDIQKIEVTDFVFKDCVMYEDQDNRNYRGVRFPIPYEKLDSSLQLKFFDLTCNIQKTSGQDIYVCYSLDEIFSYYPDYPRLYGRYEVVIWLISDSAFTIQKTLTDPSGLTWWESGPGYGTYTFKNKTINVCKYDLEVAKWQDDIFAMTPPKITPYIPPVVAKDIIMSYRNYSVYEAFCIGNKYDE